MYDADIEYGMKLHPWRKILDQCFVTRREPYHQCGGLLQEFGHFSEWLLAARYHAAGYEIGYLPDARFHHYYIGARSELKAFTLDFVTGEIGYFSQGAHAPGGDLLEVPPEWACRQNFDAGAAREILRMIVRDLVAANVVGDGRWQSLRAIGRWIFPAISGDGPARAVSAAASTYAYLAMMLVILVGTREQLGHSLKAYIGALIRRQRLNRIAHDGRRREPDWLPSSGAVSRSPFSLERNRSGNLHSRLPRPSHPAHHMRAGPQFVSWYRSALLLRWPPDSGRGDIGWSGRFRDPDNHPAIGNGDSRVALPGVPRDGRSASSRLACDWTRVDLTRRASNAGDAVEQDRQASTAQQLRDASVPQQSRSVGQVIDKLPGNVRHDRAADLDLGGCEAEVTPAQHLHFLDADRVGRRGLLLVMNAKAGEESG
jgi:hypothetical protein